MRTSTKVVSYFILGLFVSSLASAAGYTNQYYRFTLNVPPGWIYRERPTSTKTTQESLGSDVVLILAARSEGTAELFNPNITIAIRDVRQTVQLSDSKSIEDLAVRTLGEIPFGSSSGTVKTFKHNGLFGAERQLEYQQQYGAKVTALSVVVTVFVSAQQGRCFLITAAAPAQSFAQYEAIFRNVIESFHELDSTPST